ncbi:MAG: ribonuclease P protein component 4 [Sulfolobaceae archaeon]
MRYLKRIEKLILQAEELARSGELELSREYIKLALVYSSKTHVKIPLKLKRKFCRKCKTPLIPGLTERRRIRGKVLIRTCICCGWIRRYVLRRYKNESEEGKS